MVLSRIDGTRVDITDLSHCMEDYNIQRPGVHRAQARRPSPGDLRRAGGATLRIGLRLWGLEDRLESWFDDLPGHDGRSRWEIVHQREGDGADLVIHLVKLSSAVLSSFCWNRAGAAHTMPNRTASRLFTSRSLLAM